MKNFLSKRAVAAISAILLTLVPLSLRGQDAQAEVTTIYGSQIYTESGVQWGIYSFPAQADTQFTPVWVSGDLMATGGAVYAGGKYYIISFLDFGFMVMGYFITCDVDKQEMTPLEITDWNLSYLTTDMAYDPTSGKIYGCSMNADGSGTFNLSTMDVSTGKQTPVAPLMQMCAMAVDNDGTLYGIGQTDGKLYKIDKATAELTEVGHTGVQPSENQQSATYDAANGVMYWSAYTADGGALYTVDTATGAATLVSMYPDKAEMIGIYVKEPEVAQVQPQQLTDVEMNFERDALSGRAAFTMPALDIAGNPLSGTLEYVVQQGENEIVAGTAEPSATVEVDVAVEQRGMHNFSFTAKNAAGAATAVKIVRFVGMDDPAPVGNIRVSKDENSMVSLKWYADTVGMHGGYVDTSRMVYDVIRQPQGTKVGDAIADSAFADTPDSEDMAAIYYGIVPRLDTLKGDTALSPLIVVGTHKTVPYTEEFDHWTDFALYEVCDLNGDEASWVYNFDINKVCYLWAFADTNDDWLITPPVSLKAGREYAMTAVLRSEDDVYAGTVGMAVGKAAEAAAMTQVIHPGADIDKKDAAEIVSETFKVEADGNYHLGLHVSGASAIYYIYIDRLQIDDMTGVGISRTGIGNAGVTLRSTGGSLAVGNSAGHLVRIYNTAGACVAESGESSFSVTLPKGVYVVKAAGNSLKIAL